MTSPRRKQGKPIESVELKIGFRADRKTLLRIKKAVPEAEWRKGEIEVKLSGAEPARMADQTKELSDRVRMALEEGGGAGRKGGKFQKTLSNAKGSAIRK
jgi:hypothetical protein